MKLCFGVNALTSPPPPKKKVVVLFQQECDHRLVLPDVVDVYMRGSVDFV